MLVMVESARELAYREFQAAARNKDTDPQTFESARLRYYTLTKGPKWAAHEQKKLTIPLLAQYQSAYSTLESELKTQETYTSSIEKLRDQQQSLKDHVVNDASYLQKLIQTERNKKGVFDRYVELTQKEDNMPTSLPFFANYFAGFPDSFAVILDVVIALFILFIGWVLVKKYTAIPTPPSISLSVVPPV